jgi:transcriptional regulator with XRE-family HTH domain
MGYRGKVKEQEEARRLRAQNLTLAEIAKRLGVSKSSVFLWVRDVPFTPSKRRYGPRRRPHPAHLRKLEEIERLNEEGRLRIGTLSGHAFFAAGISLYAGEGSKTEGSVRFANTDPTMMRFFATWLRAFFDIDEARLRVRVYLHEGLDLDAAEAHRSDVTGVPRTQFRKAYRAVPDPSIRLNKHEFGCGYLEYSCTRTHRAVMGLVRALLSSDSYSGVAQLVAQRIVNPTVAGSSPAPGAELTSSSLPTRSRRRLRVMVRTRARQLCSVRHDQSAD